ncbi:UDP-glucose/GDP-mannose dehydrogenase family protein [Aureimonas altamirensis]|uniref:UDP-glucose dehydrogenase family protein n=1 Tax=Aureimonas altamirensis TaxID=370622 RepID=UPI001E63B27A|nr:UDP-glucose/GDP-mannose dehydrogenase family protein [Aureimonas altamirensis]UHD44239.1 UDP-glucose/GDP-mannose dehydrogenase family protein [Aureimonas altamirensis]
MRIAMIGCGYVGLVSGACLADFGHDVTAVDRDSARIEALESGVMPIFEPGLDQLVATNVSAGRLRFSQDMQASVADADVVFIAVGTPSRRGDGHADISFVESAVEGIARHLKPGAVVATKSTVPVGTGDRIAVQLARLAPSRPVSVVSNPEFLRQGAAIEDFCRPDRIVVGTEDAHGRAVMEAVYGPLSINRAPLLFTGRRDAELVKYAGNAFLAMKIEFINEMADLCERLGADVQEVARGIGLDNRIGPKFLHAGPGYGGSCFPKDTQALLETARAHGAPLALVEATVAGNLARKEGLAARVAHALGGSVEGMRVALLGLSFKPNTDDMREAPSIHLAQALQAAGAEVTATDPRAMDNARGLLPGVRLVEDAYEAARGADAVVLVTEWNAYRALDLAALSTRMRGNVFIDLRNVYSHAAMAEHGLIHHGVGRGPAASALPLQRQA